MKNTTKLLFLSSFVLLTAFLWVFAIWSLITLGITWSGGFLDDPIEISVLSRIFVNILNLMVLSFGFLLIFDMSKVVFKKDGINKKQLRRTLYFFLGSLALVVTNYTLLQNGISIFG